MPAIAVAAAVLGAWSVPAAGADEAQTPAPVNAQAPAQPPTLEDFARLPQASSVAISPDGRWLAAVIHRDTGSVVITRAIDSDAPPKALLTADERGQYIAWVHWVSNQRLVVSVHYPSHRSHVDDVESRLTAIDRDGQNRLMLDEPGGFGGNRNGQFQDRVVDWLPEDGHHLLLQVNRAYGDGAPDVVRLNVDTGRRLVVQSRMRDVRGWIADRAHRVRVGVRQDGTQVEVLFCDPDGDHWRTGWSYTLFSGESVRPLGFGSDPNLLYLVHEHEGRRQAEVVDLRDAALTPKTLIAGLGPWQGGDLLLDPVTGQAIGLSGTQSESAAASFWDPSAQALARAVDAALPGRVNRLLGFSADGMRYLVFSSGNGLPGEYLVGDKSQHQMQLLNSQYPALAKATLARKRREAIPVPEGGLLEAWLTVPVAAGTTAGHGLPTVIVAGAGPLGHLRPDFDVLTTFLASRGYAVLQLVPRDASNQVGLPPGAKWNMTDDLLAAAHWAVQRGTAQPQHVCLMGEGWGAYAALLAAAQAPTAFSGVVSYAGIGDLLALGYHRASFVNGLAVFEQAQGSTWSDSDKLKASSPSRLAGRFQTPVLLVHGSEDRSVPFSQSQAMADALQAAGKPVRLVSLPEGDHDLSDGPLRLQFFQAMDGFLAQQCGTGAALTASATH
jgi:dipeptidyl aminopeptidase/acylaminoacyl peptidase